MFVATSKLFAVKLYLVFALSKYEVPRLVTFVFLKNV